VNPEILYKENWEEAKKRLTAFWQKGVIGRPCIHITAPREGKYSSPEPRDFKEKWTDPEYIIKNAIAQFESIYYGGEAIPAITLLVGYAFAYGAPLHFSEQTIWHEPIFNDVEDYKNFNFDYSSDWGWQQIKNVVQAMAKAGEGKFIVGQPAIIQANDLFSILRGTEKFCIDLIEHPEEVKAVLSIMRKNWLSVYTECDTMLSKRIEGSTSWLPIWSPGKMSTIQSDVSCMISPKMFEKFIMPELIEVTEHIEHIFYHLDGPDAIKHLDRLLDIPGIFGVQWTPGSGRPTSLSHWLPMYKKIQEKGKGLCPPAIHKDELETAIKDLRPEGLFLLVEGASSAAEAEGLLVKAEEWTKKYWRV
jgi:hypothetical protein